LRTLQPQKFGREPFANDRVDRTERLVHQHERRLGGHGARDADALALATGELRGIPVAHAPGVEADEREQLFDARADARGRPAEKLRHRRDVLADRPVWEEADLLDDVPDPSPELRRI